MHGELLPCGECVTDFASDSCFARAIWVVRQGNSGATNMLISSRLSRDYETRTYLLRIYT